MLSFFKSQNSKNTSKAHKKSNISGSDLKPQRDGVMEKKVMENAERELYRYDQPKQDLGMSDLIKNHEDGTRFMYAAITGKENEELSSKLRRLVSFQPTLRRKAIPVDNLPVVKLYRETETFPLDQIVPMNGKKKSYGDYIRLSDVIIMYGAVVSPDCNFTKVQIGISDNRLLSDKMVKSFTATTNMMTKGNLALPYCIPTSDADQLVLTISRERSFLDEGRQWGAIQIQLILEFTSFPMQYDNQPIAALNMLPSTALEDPLNNPNNLDISILNQDRRKLAELYLSGDLADENEPIKNKTSAVKYAKSSISGPKGKTIEPSTSDWSFMKDKRVGQINADQNSIDPEVDGSYNINSEEDETFVSPEKVYSNESTLAEVQASSSIRRPPTPPLKSSMKTSNLDQSKVVSFNNNKKGVTPW